MKLAIVILNWNGSKMLRQYLPSVLNYSRDEATVYVADNASTDDSIGLLKEHFPECRLILLEKNWGFAEGYNKALAQIDAEYFLLLNSDIEVTHHWLTPMIEFMDAHPDVAACQPKLLSVFDHDRFEYAGACGGFLDRYGYPFCRGRIFETVEDDNGQYDTPSDLLWATGAALFVRARIYKEVGGLDGRFFAHCEEIDLCWRLRLRGWRVVCLPESKVLTTWLHGRCCCSSATGATSVPSIVPVVPSSDGARILRATERLFSRAGRDKPYPSKCPSRCSGSIM